MICIEKKKEEEAEKEAEICGIRCYGSSEWIKRTLAPTPIVSSLPAGVFALAVPNSIKCLIECLAKLFHCIRDVQNS